MVYVVMLVFVRSAGSGVCRNAYFVRSAGFGVCRYDDFERSCGGCGVCRYAYL